MVRTNAHRRSRRGGEIARVVIVIGAAVMLCASSLAAGQAPPEFQVKAVFLSNFPRFVEWPPEGGEDDPTVVIGVLGADPFGIYLDEMLQGQQVNGRPLVVKRYDRVSAVGRCHVLFVSGSEGGSAEQILAALRGRPILTVCDTTVFARHGAMIHLVMDEHRVRLRINLAAARGAGLVISAKLLRTAEIVRRAGEAP